MKRGVRLGDYASQTPLPDVLLTTPRSRAVAEMTLPQLYHFLSEVQKAKAVMDSY